MMAEIKEQNARRARALLTAELQKLMLLCEHFGISTDPLPPGWTRDLALCLARRHEGLFTKGSTRSYSDIFAAYGVDPDQSEADLVLANCIAQKHVPGLSYSQHEPAPSRIESAQLASLTIAVEAIRVHLRQAGKQGSDRQVALVLSSPDELASIIPKTAAEALTDWIETSGNDDRTKPRPLSPRAIREYLRQMREAWKAVGEGDATAFQVQFVTEVLPLLDELSRQQDEEAGQI